MNEASSLAAIFVFVVPHIEEDAAAAVRRLARNEWPHAQIVLARRTKIRDTMTGLRPDGSKTAD